MLGRTNVLVLLCTLLLAVRSTAALYFYLEPDTPKCFLEELPNDTVVVGHYMTEEWDTTLQRFVVKDDMGIHISVREVRDDHVVTSSRGPPEGKFAFTSHEAGDHRICMLAKFDGRPAVQVRMHLDIVIGDAKPDNSHKDKAHVTDLAQRVRDLNALLRDIRKEQQYQREREAQFRDLSEVTNSRAMWWSSLQLITLLGACVWQLRHLRVSFLTPPRRSIRNAMLTLIFTTLYRGSSRTRSCANSAAEHSADLLIRNSPHSSRAHSLVAPSRCDCTVLFPPLGVCLLVCLTEHKRMLVFLRLMPLSTLRGVQRHGFRFGLGRRVVPARM